MSIRALAALLAVLSLTAPRATAQEEPPTAGSAVELLAQADQLFRGRRYADAGPVYERAAERAAAEGDGSVQAEALAQVARMASLTVEGPGRLEEARRWLERAAQVASDEQPLGWTRYLGVRGILEREEGHAEQALATFTEMHDYARARDLPRRAIDAAHHAAIVAPTEDQVTWAERGIAAAEELGDEGWLAVLWNNLGSTHEDRGDWTAAADAYERARDYHHRGGGERQRLIADWAVGRASLRAGRAERAAELLPDVLQRARAAHEAQPDAETAEWVGWALAAHGEMLVGRGEAAAGLEQLREGRALLITAGIEDWWPDGLADLDRVIAEAEDR
jgi:tetratricopeptide (TPR) repeat protein